MPDRWRTTRYLICLLMVVAATSCAASVDGQAILKRMIAADKQVAYTARQVTTLSRGQVLTSEQIVYRDGLKGMRLEYTSPSRLAGEVLVDDGHSVAHYIPRDKVVRIRPSRLAWMSNQASYGDRGSSRHGDLKAELVGRDKIAGRPAYVIQISSHRHHGATRKFWVDTEKWVRLKTEESAPDGAVISTSYFTEINYVDSVPASKFHFQPPSGVRVERAGGAPKSMPMAQVRKEAGFRIMSPTYLPSGFKQVGSALIPFRGQKLAALRFSDGINTFTLFQAPEELLDQRYLHRLHAGPVRGREIYSWKVKGLNLTLMGAISQDQMRKVAGSVK